MTDLGGIMLHLGYQFDLFSIRPRLVELIFFYLRSPGNRLRWDFGTPNCWKETVSSEAGVLKEDLMCFG